MVAMANYHSFIPFSICYTAFFSPFDIPLWYHRGGKCLLQTEVMSGKYMY